MSDFQKQLSNIAVECLCLRAFLHRVVVFGTEWLLQSDIAECFAHVIFTTAMLYKYYQYPQFTEKEIESFREIK